MEWVKALENRAVVVNPPPARQTEFTNGPLLTVRMFNVGPGEVVLVVFPGNRAWFVDCGHTSTKGGNEDLATALMSFLESSPLSVEACVASHAHIDHAGALETLLPPSSPALTRPFTVYRGTADWESNKGWRRRYADMVKANSPNNVQEVALVDQHLEVSITDDCVAHLFNGSGKSAYSSLFLHLRFGSAQLLFTGDASCSYESKLVKKYGAPDFRADVLKVTHHGASDGTAANVLADIKPSIAIASTTAEKHHRLEQDTLDRLRDTTPGTQRQILETALVGDIIIETDGRPFDDGILYRVDSQAPGILAGPLGVTTTTESQINRGQDNVSSCK